MISSCIWHNNFLLELDTTLVVACETLVRRVRSIGSDFRDAMPVGLDALLIESTSSGCLSNVVGGHSGGFMCIITDTPVCVYYGLGPRMHIHMS